MVRDVKMPMGTGRRWFMADYCYQQSFLKKTAGGILGQLGRQYVDFWQKDLGHKLDIKLEPYHKVKSRF